MKLPFSFVAEGHERINFRRAVRWYEAGNQGNGDENRARYSDGNRISGWKGGNHGD